jgi:hypothetical protein
MPRRKKDQSVDFVAGALKRMMWNKEGFTPGQLAWMYKAAYSLAKLDGDKTFTESMSPDTQTQIETPARPALPTEDDLLAPLRAKHGTAGGADANPQN